MAQKGMDKVCHIVISYVSNQISGNSLPTGKFLLISSRLLFLFSKSNFQTILSEMLSAQFGPRSSHFLLKMFLVLIPMVYTFHNLFVLQGYVLMLNTPTKINQF